MNWWRLRASLRVPSVAQHVGAPILSLTAQRDPPTIQGCRWPCGACSSRRTRDQEGRPPIPQCRRAPPRAAATSRLSGQPCSRHFRRQTSQQTKGALWSSSVTEAWAHGSVTFLALQMVHRAHHWQKMAGGADSGIFPFSNAGALQASAWASSAAAAAAAPLPAAVPGLPPPGACCAAAGEAPNADQGAAAGALPAGAPKGLLPPAPPPNAPKPLVAGAPCSSGWCMASWAGAAQFGRQLDRLGGQDLHRPFQTTSLRLPAQRSTSPHLRCAKPACAAAKGCGARRRRATKRRAAKPGSGLVLVVAKLDLGAA